ncbi:MAG: hypothetical protein EXQ52_16940 [Bryobacterales bacterium]|nr:hypothetical protein [Bryobacterales bacterium]
MRIVCVGARCRAPHGCSVSRTLDNCIVPALSVVIDDKVALVTRVLAEATMWSYPIRGLDGRGRNGFANRAHCLDPSSAPCFTSRTQTR